ncbi:MAG: hypothetical protein HBSAPP02_24010 [Phycisphaerae bacterium]|nr:MAG: hypothetical protein HBSAPP02_24010 [Phycisphaerae bacterium]
MAFFPLLPGGGDFLLGHRLWVLLGMSRLSLNSDSGAVSFASVREGAHPQAGLGRQAMALLFLAWVLFALITLSRGPSLGDHEVIVAQIARQTLQTGDWIVPQYLDTPFLMKPPLAPWLVAAVTKALPDRWATHWISEEFIPRLPSVLATLATALILLRLARDMFGVTAARITTFAYLTSVGAMLFALNATVEAVLTLLCTWAFAEFWWSRRATGSARRWHQAAFYLALGLAMLAKGPMPLMVVCAPIAVYWWLDRPLRRLTAARPGRIRGAMSRLVFDAWPRLKLALTSLGLWWGVPLFLMMFLPWMFLVARREPYFWELWNYEYLDRLEGDYPGVKSGGYWYYAPLLLGLAMPWSLSVPEALAAPFLRAYRSHRRPMRYAWCWVLVTVAILSLMSFKKPYYLLPALPGCMLLLGPVLERFFLHRPAVNPRRTKWIGLVFVVLASAGAIIAWFVGDHMFHEAWHPPVTWGTLVIAGLIIAGMYGAVRLYGAAAAPTSPQRIRSLVAVGASCVTGFLVTWTLLGPALGNCDDPRALVQHLRDANVSDDAPLYWASNRPDGRVTYYCRREVLQVMDPYKLIAQRRNRASNEDLRRTAATRLCELLESERPVYIVFEREDYENLKLFYRPPARLLCEVDRGEAGADEDDWVVATNAGVSRQP